MNWVFNNGQEISVRQEGKDYPQRWAQHLQKHNKLFKGQASAWQDWRTWEHEGRDKTKMG